MKKISLILCIAIIAVSASACGGKDKSDKGESKGESSSQISGSASSNTETESADSVSILEKVWGTYSEDEKFPVAGGDFSVANMEGPGKYNIDDPDAIDHALGFPSAEIDKIDDAASLTHMMNTNTFTCGVYHFKNTDDVTITATSIKDNIMKRQWMCGFPDKLVIINIGDYIVSAFGNEDLVNTFKTKVTGSYPSATIISEDPIL